jgi:glucose-6-phosphate isomerase
MNNIKEPEIIVNYLTGELRGDGLQSSIKLLSQLEGVFEDTGAFARINPETVVYKVQCQLKEKEGTEGGLFFGTSFVSPGCVGEEYFMTKGHFHLKKDRAEYYWCIEGEGMLILMDEERNCWAEKMYAGSLHYIPGNIAHRIANTGETILAVGACWPSDAGHDYDSITKNGFSARLKKIGGRPVLVPVER